MNPPPPVIRMGDCFKYTKKAEFHLFMVISDPGKDADRVVIVNTTTEKAYKDRTCILGPQHHSSLTHSSCVNYPFAQVQTAAHLDSQLASGTIELLDRLSDAVLSRIQEGALLSPLIPDGSYRVLIEQADWSDADEQPGPSLHT